MLWTSSKLISKYIEFYKSKGHKEISSARLIPENDPTVLFTTAGMHPLVPYLNGEKHPNGTKLVNVQRCIRTGDIDEVGDNTHLTFFEMLGNWSLGEYFKEEAIKLSFEFLTGKDWLNIPLEKLAVTVFQGDNDAPKDEEAYKTWETLGIPKHKISYLPKKDNWWGPAGQTGPCGPDSEMFYYVGEGLPSIESNVETDPDNWVELWNDVFMQYEKTQEGKFVPLKQKNVDTGMGVERTVVILNGKTTVYETEIFAPILNLIKKVSSDYKEKNARIIADHTRTIAFMAMDGMAPSNLDQGYVMRKLIRRVLMNIKKLEIHEDSVLEKITTIICNLMGESYPKLLENKDEILKTISDEEKQFSKALEVGTREFNKLASKMEEYNTKNLSGRKAFVLYETYGLPFEVLEELAKEKGFEVDKEGFDKAYKKHQESSRAGAEQKFKGGLADSGEETTKLHTATHLLHKSLQNVLGGHIKQKGSNITNERLRFDFCHGEKMTSEELKAVEDMVNEQIKKEFDIECEEMTVEEAKEKGAIGLFEHKYGEKVKVYFVGDFSKEICGGPHVKNTRELGSFKIKKEQSSSKGVRRIKGVLN